jgi:hypothetical protein
MAALLAVGLVSSVAAQQLYRCVDPAGNVSWGFAATAPAGLKCDVVTVPPAGPPPAADAPNSPTAIARCKAAVLSRLKAPGTARFVSGSYHPGQTWAVVGEVDAQNTYGALVRSTYGCQMRGGLVVDVEIATRR